MLITSPKRTPLIKSSNMSTWKRKITSYGFLLQTTKENKVFSLVILDGYMRGFGINLNMMVVISFKHGISFVEELAYTPYIIDR